MRIFRTVTVACLCIVAFAGLGAGAASARTPTPTSTPVASATPSAQQIDTFRGQAWLNGRQVGGPIAAKIGGVDCGEPSTSVTPADSTASVYTIAVLSNDVRAGCGTPGAIITFFVQGVQASQTATWQAGAQETLILIAGPPFGTFSGTMSSSRAVGGSVVPFVNGQPCGYDEGGGFIDPAHNYSVIVFSTQQQAGCGAEGAQVNFKLLDGAGNVVGVAQQTGVWHAWDVLSAPQQLNLTIAPVGSIKMGNVGTGDGSGESRIGSRLAVLLGLAGFAGVAAGFGLRRRAVAR